MIYPNSNARDLAELASKGPSSEVERLRAALREIVTELDCGEIMHGMDCQEIVGPKCICSIAKIRTIVERAVGGES